MKSIYDLLKQYKNEPQKLVEILCVDSNDEREQAEYREEFEGQRQRRDSSVGKRENKIIGEGVNKKIIEVARLVFAFPKKIVRTAVAFLFGGDMVISASENGKIESFKECWEDRLKMHSMIKKFSRTIMIETKAALLFYPITEGENEEKTADIRVVLLDYNSGSFYPHFDKYNDMDAFTRRYQTKSDDNKEITIVEVFTSQKIHIFTKENGKWSHVEKPNLFKKIPVVYAEQNKPEWEDVVSLIDEFEMRLSRLADTNDYFSEPILKLFGKPKTLPGKDKVGKMVEFSLEKSLDGSGRIQHGDAQYLTWDQTPESIKLELEMLWNGIFSMTSTPDLTFDNLKGLGNLSGTAIRMMTIDAILKAEDKREVYDEAIKRMVSVVKAGLVNVCSAPQELNKTAIKVKFGSPLPNDLAQLIETLGKAKQDGLASTETLVSQIRSQI